MTHTDTIVKKQPLSPVQFNLMMLLCIIVWALAFPFIKIGLQELSFTTLTILRFAIVSGAALLIILFRKQTMTKVQKKDVFPIFLLGFFGVMIYHFGLNYGEQYVSASVASLIIATIPVLSVLLARLILKETLTRKKTLGVILALSGVIIISIYGTYDTILEITYFFAATSIFIAALMGSLYTIAGKKLLTRYTPLSLTLYAMLFSSIVLIPTAIFTPSFSFEVIHLSLKGWFAVIFLGVCSTVIGYVLWYVALTVKSASEVSTYLYGIPVLSTLISFVLFDERLTGLFIVGGALVICGLLLVNKKTTWGINKQEGQ